MIIYKNLYLLDDILTENKVKGSVLVKIGLIKDYVVSNNLITYIFYKNNKRFLSVTKNTNTNQVMSWEGNESIIFIHSLLEKFNI